MRKTPRAAWPDVSTHSAPHVSPRTVPSTVGLGLAVAFALKVRIDPLPALSAATVALLIFCAVTAPFFNCFVPTLFFGRLIAAYVVPPSATNNAKTAITSAGLGFLIRRFMTGSPVFG